MAASGQFYGVADTFMMYTHNGGKSSARMGSGGASDSYWGITAVEDLGEGLRVRFRLEGDMLTTNGNHLNPVAMYNREANIAVSSDTWGTLKLGKQFPAALSLTADPFFFVQRLSPAAVAAQIVRDLGPGVAAIQVRVNDAISYQTPSMNGLVISALYAPRQSRGLVVGNGDNDTSSKFVDGDAGVLATYARGPWTFGGSYNALRPARPMGPGNVPLGLSRTDLIIASAAYTVGALQTSIAYGLIRSTAPATFPVQIMSFGSLLQQGAHTFRASLLYRIINGRSDNTVGGMVGYDYQLSKRVGVYARMGGFRNSSRAAFGVAASLPQEIGASTTLAAFGITQRF